MTRLQGDDWQNIKDDLIIIAYRISSNHNIKIFCKHRITKQKFCHWLSDSEKRLFNKWKENGFEKPII